MTAWGLAAVTVAESAAVGIARVSVRETSSIATLIRTSHASFAANVLVVSAEPAVANTAAVMTDGVSGSSAVAVTNFAAPLLASDLHCHVLEVSGCHRCAVTAHDRLRLRLRRAEKDCYGVEAHLVLVATGAAGCPLSNEIVGMRRGSAVEMNHAVARIHGVEAKIGVGEEVTAVGQTLPADRKSVV